MPFESAETSQPGVAQLVARVVWDPQVGGSSPSTRTMQSVLIGSEYPVMDTLLFYFSQNSYCNLFRGVAECYAFSRFHDNVGLRDIPAIRHIESADAVVVDHDTLIGKAADQRDGECQSEGGDSLQSISSAATSSETSMYSSWVYQA